MRADHRALLVIAAPLWISTLAEFALGALDTAFLGRLGPPSVAAVAIAASIYIVPLQLLVGLGVGFQILGARGHGAGNREERASLFVNTVLLLAAAAVAGIAFVWSSSWLVGTMTDDPAVRADAMAYLRIRSVGLLVFAVSHPLVQSLDTMGQTRWGMYATVASVLADAGLDYIFIFGLGPIPGFGVEGAAATSVVASGIRLGVAAWAFRKVAPFRISSAAVDLGAMRRIGRLGAFAVADGVLDYAGGVVFVSFAGALGVAELAASRVVYQCLLVVFFTVFSLGLAAQIRASHHLGRRDMVGARHQTQVGLQLAVLVAMIAGLAYAAWPDALARLFFGGEGGATGPVSGGLRVVALSAPLMAFAVCEAGFLKALRRTDLVMYINLGAIWLVQLPIGWLVGVHLGHGVAGLYLGFLAYFLARAVAGRVVATSLFGRALAAGRPGEEGA